MAENKKIRIVTHNGAFHADEIFAVAVLKLFLVDTELEIIRTRDIDLINNADYVLDVGSIYDESKNRFDHHQEGGAGKRENGIPYASFGLVWKKFGEKVSGDIRIAKKIDQALIQPIDAIDNGLQYVNPIFPEIYPYDIGLYLDAFMPSWKEGMTNIDDIFFEMLSRATELLRREISKRSDKLEAESIVIKIYENSLDKRLIILDKAYPSREFLSRFPEPLYIVFPEANGNWNLKTVRSNINSFVNRKDLPRKWSGKRDKEFEMVSGVPDVIFCHKECWFAVAKTKEAIIKLAEIALNS
jgi:uncharacterized UPF0160 family protein